MSKISRTKALEYISNWSTSNVIDILKKNGLEECCPAILKRQIDGDELLHLTEGKLALWKSDLSRSQTWSLWNFVEALNRAPEEHIEPTTITDDNEHENVSDTGSWGTDFEDDDDDDDSLTIRKNNNAAVLRKNNVQQRSTDFRNSLMVFQNREKLAQSQKQLNKNNNNNNNRPESIYMNCENDQVDHENHQENQTSEEMYMNLEHEAESAENRSKSVNEMHKIFEKTLGEQFNNRMASFKNQKPEIPPEKPPKINHHKLIVPSRSFNSNNVDNKEPKKPAILPPRSQSISEKPDDLPKPPVMLRNFDLVANLPTKTDESDDEYEAFDEHIIEQNRLKVEPNQSFIKRSNESVYKTPSTTSQEKDEEIEDCEIYESITENPDETSYYITPISSPTLRETPPRPVHLNLLDSAPNSSASTSLKSANKNERSPDKKSATLPHPGSSTSLSFSAEMRATRPLPPPPFGQSYSNFPWFHNVTREQANALIKERAYSIAHNGYFLIRPSTHDINSPLILVVWLKDRVYNVPVRKRGDGRYSLGTLKPNELTFTTVEEIIMYYSREELPIYSSGKPMGSTKLTESPPK